MELNIHSLYHICVAEIGLCSIGSQYFYLIIYQGCILKLKFYVSPGHKEFTEVRLVSLVILVRFLPVVDDLS